MRGCIIEGVTASGKSSIFRQIQRNLLDKQPANTKLLLSEHYTERTLEHLMHAGELTEDRVIAHLRGLLEPLRQLKTQKS